MSKLVSEVVDSTESSNEIFSLNKQELADVKSAGSSQGTRVTSEEVARQIGAVTDPLFKQVKLLRD